MQVSQTQASSWPTRLRMAGLGLLVAGLSGGALATPAVDDCPNNRLCVEVVVDAQGCPAYTRYDGVRDKVPQLQKSSAKKMVWYLVDEAGTEQPKRFQVYFDPFKKPEINGVGHDTSPSLATDVPVDVDFKYTVVTEGCTPMDPRIRVLN